MYNRDVDFNYATEDNNVKVISCTSYKPGNHPNNILKSSSKSYWLSQKNVPQYITLDLTEMIKRPKHGLRFIGFYCRHSHLANPREIQLVCSEDNKIYERFGGYEIVNQSGIQLYEIENWELLQVRKNHSKGFRYNYITIVVTKNYGGERTYLNQLLLFESLINYPTRIITDLSTPEELIEKAREFDDSLSFVFKEPSERENDAEFNNTNDNHTLKKYPKYNHENDAEIKIINQKDLNKVMCLSLDKSNDKLNDQLKDLDEYIHSIHNTNPQNNILEERQDIKHNQMNDDIYESMILKDNNKHNALKDNNKQYAKKNNNNNNNNASSTYTFIKKGINNHANLIEKYYDNQTDENINDIEVAKHNNQEEHLANNYNQFDHINSKIDIIETEISNLKTSINKINITLDSSMRNQKEQNDIRIKSPKSIQQKELLCEKDIESKINKTLQNHDSRIEKEIYSNYLKPTIKDIEVKINSSLDQMKKTIDDFNKQNKKKSRHSTISSLDNSLISSQARFDKMQMISEKLYSKLLLKEEKLSKASAYLHGIQI